MMKKNNPHSELIGLTKKELILRFGDEFNFYPDDLWIYLINKNFLGKKTFLVVLFKDNMVINVNITKTYGKFKKTGL